MIHLAIQLPWPYNQLLGHSRPTAQLVSANSDLFSFWSCLSRATGDNFTFSMVTWSEAFTIFMLILTSYFPHRWKDLTSYKLLILRTYCQLSGHVWLANDQAFCQHAAVTKLVDWSTMNIHLYNFHAAGASVHSGSGGSLSKLPEPSGADSSQVICWSWNRGRCSAQFASCQFTNHCSVCAGSHCTSECSPCFEKTSSYNRKGRSASPPSAPLSALKSRR